MTIHYSCDNDLARNVFNENILNIFNSFFSYFLSISIPEESLF